jgi:hypothetical protein
MLDSTLTPHRATPTLPKLSTRPSQSEIQSECVFLAEGCWSLNRVSEAVLLEAAELGWSH